MNKPFFQISFVFLTCFSVLFSGSQVLAQVGGLSVQTNPATNIGNYQATLNGYAANPVWGATTYAWFQWGTDTNYANESTHQTLSYAGSFSQNITNLQPNTFYHFRAVAQTNYGTVYGQDLTFCSGGQGNCYGSGYLTVSKRVINLTSGNLNWQTSVNAKPLDIVSFVITMQANGQDVHNVFVRDVLPSGLTYTGNLLVNASQNYQGNPMAGINAGTIPAGGIFVISYQAQVAPSLALAYGITTLSNSAAISSTEGGNQTASAQVLANNSAAQGATYPPTGVSNNPIKDSFFLPLFLITLGSWLYFSGRIYKFSDWLVAKMD